MKKILGIVVVATVIFMILIGCNEKDTPKIGVAFGVGPATRWATEIKYMKAYAQGLGIEFEARLNTNENEKPLAEDCYELIDSGIDVLITRPRDVKGMKEIVDYAHSKNVEIISYDSIIENEQIDLFVGYDSKYTGAILAQHLTEIVPEGDYIMLWGDMNKNIEDMYTGAMEYMKPNDGKINIILEATVPGWSVDEAKKMVKEAIVANDNKIDAIFAFSDKLAGAAAEVVEELGITEPVVIAGMDAELDAARRIVTGTQACTAYMDLEELAQTAIDEAVQMANGNKPKTNAETNNNSANPIPSYLLVRKIVTKENLDRVLIDSSYYTKNQVYDPVVK